MYLTIGEWIWEIFSQIYKSKWPGNAMWSSPFSRIIISMGFWFGNVESDTVKSRDMKHWHKNLSTLL
jgi:hypothetical protein